MGEVKCALIKHPIIFFLLGQISILALECVYRTIIFEYPSQNNVKQLQFDEDFSRRYARQATMTRAQCIDQSKLPYKCGVVFFYHIPSTGGATITHWLRKYSSNQNGTAKYFQKWDRTKNGRAKNNTAKVFNVGNRKHGGMSEFVKGINEGEWRIAHCHHSSLNLNVSEHLLSQWRSSVESQGCAFVANVMLRDPLSHSLSLFKHIGRFSSSRDTWLKHIRTKSDMGHWQTQLDYFLYNLLARNPDGVDKETKVRRALELLRNHFDIVAVGDHERYKKELLEMTGWGEKEMVRTNTYSKEMLFTKEEVEEIQKMIYENGDTEFIYEVKSLYQNNAKAGSD